MSYIVSARKYRPTKFDEVVGQQHVATTLQLALSNDHLAHAFLFTGPRGVGKTTCARILAKLINCENPVDKKDPCDQCPSCLSFNKNSSFNIIELDGASNNKVEHIRTMIQQVRIAPQNGNYKVFIIDEVHMLTTQAFNAFLKTLEEPPPYAIFILATTEKHKIIPTILSRCQIFDFKRIQVPEIVTQLEGICKKEGIKPEKEALTIIAQKADGAMRDALSIYDRIAGSITDTLTYKDVVSNLNLLDYDYFFELTDALVQEDLSAVFLIFDKILKQGFDPDQLLSGLSQHFRELLVSKDPRTIQLLDYSDKLKERYFNQSQLCNKRFLLTGLNILNVCDINLPRAKNKNLHTEIALSKITYINRIEEIASEKKKLIPTNKTQTNKKAAPTSSFNTPPIGNQVADQTIAPSNNITSTPTVVKSKSDNIVQDQELVKDQDILENNKPTNNPNPSKTKSKVGQLVAKNPEILNKSVVNVDNLLNNIAQQKLDKEAQRKEVSIDHIKLVWEEYINETDSTAVKSCLKMSQYELLDDKLVVYTPNNISKSDILNQKPLLERLRKDFMIQNFVMEIIVDPGRFPDYILPEKKKTLSVKEKYEKFKAVNPKIDDFVKKFELKIKQE